MKKRKKTEQLYLPGTENLNDGDAMGGDLKHVAFNHKTEEFLAYLAGALVTFLNDGTPLYLQEKKLHIQNALSRFGALCFLDDKMRGEWPKLSCPETFFRYFPEGRLGIIFSAKKWEKRHYDKIRDQKWLEKPDLPLWYLEDGKLEVEEGFLMELFPGIDSKYFSKGSLTDIAQARVYQMLRAMGQKGYIRGRRYLIENPLLKNVPRAKEENPDLDTVIDASYEQVSGGLVCPDCGWLADPEMKFCPVCDGDLKNASEKAKSMWRLRYGIMRFIAKPGILEFKIAEILEKRKIDFEWWPKMDMYDFRVKTGNGRVLCLDAKDFCASPTKSIISAADKMRKLEVAGEKCIVVRNRLVDKATRRNTEKQHGVKVITLKELEEILDS